MTYGDIRFRLVKLLPGVDHDLLDGWISDRYQEILDRLSWQRRDVQSVIQIPAPISTGTVALSGGSGNVTGTGTGWASAITGSGLYISGRNEYYEVTWVSSTSLQLD